MVENTFRILNNHFTCLLITATQDPLSVKLVFLACVTLHNIIRTRYQVDHQGLSDQEDNDYRLIKSAWRQGQVWADLGGPERGNNS